MVKSIHTVNNKQNITLLNRAVSLVGVAFGSKLLATIGGPRFVS